MLSFFAARKATTATAAPAAALNAHQVKCLEALKTADGARDLVDRIDAEITAMDNPMNPRGRMWRKQREEAMRVYRCHRARAEIEQAAAAYNRLKAAAESEIKELRKTVVAATRATAGTEEALAKINARTAPLVQAAQAARQSAELLLQQAEQAAQARLEAAERAGDDDAATAASVDLVKAREQRDLASRTQSPEALRVETLQRHAAQAQDDLHAAQRAEGQARGKLDEAEAKLLAIELDRLAALCTLAYARAVAARARVPQELRVRTPAPYGGGAEQLTVRFHELMPLGDAVPSVRMTRLVEVENFASPDAAVFEIDPLTLPVHNDDATVVALDPQPRAAA